MDFPTLEGCVRSITEQAIDDTISSSAEAGYVTTRPRFTRVRQTIPVKMTISASDKVTLQAFDASVRGSVIFNWTHPISSNVMQVRFKSDDRPLFTPIGTASNRHYEVSFTLEEA